MVSLARKTLRHEWRRYLPAALSIAVAGLLLFAQAALVMGIFSTASVFVRASSADLWVGYPQTPSVDLGRPVPVSAEMRLRLDPQVAQVDELHWLDASWRTPGSQRHVAVVVAGVSTRADGLLFAKSLSPSTRALLQEPGAVIVDPADLSKLDIRPGGEAYIQGRRVRLVGLAPGIRSLGAVTVVASNATARWVGAGAGWGEQPTYYLARLRQGADPSKAARRLSSGVVPGRYEVWTAREFGRRTMLFWLFDTGAGLGFIASALLVFVVGAVITSQSLAGAIAGSVRELAMLRAMGITRAELGTILITKASWLGVAGLLAAALAGMVLLPIAHAAAVPVAPSVPMALLCAVAVMVVAELAGLASLGRLSRTDPSMLLRT